MTIATETHILLQAAGDPALAALAVAGSTPGRLSVDSAHGELAKVVGGYTYDPAAGLRQAADIATGFLPGEAEWAKPPLLSNWTIEPLPGGPVQTVSRYYRVGSRLGKNRP